MAEKKQAAEEREAELRATLAEKKREYEAKEEKMTVTMAENKQESEEREQRLVGELKDVKAELENGLEAHEQETTALSNSLDEEKGRRMETGAQLEAARGRVKALEGEVGCSGDLVTVLT